MKKVCFVKTRGTSVTEALVLLLVFIPLLILIPRLAKIGDFKMQTPQATRYVGWKLAIAKHRQNGDQNNLNLELKERIFKSSSLPIQTVVANTGIDGQRAFWYDHLDENRDEALFDTQQESSLSHSFSTHEAGTLSEVNQNVTSDLMSILSLGTNAPFELEQRPIAQHQLRFSINGFGLLEDCTDNRYCFSNTHAIVFDGLSMDNFEVIRDRINAYKPFSMWNSGANALATIADYSFIFEEGTEMRNMPNHVNLDVLPQDRLERGYE